MKISAVIITLNEARNIERCLRSLQDVADQVIVLDSGSKDGTVDLANNLGAKVIDTPWQGYAATKNHGHTLAEHPYILSLDADEALSDKLQASILAVKDNLQGAYSFNRLNNYCGTWIRHGGFYPDKKIRLFPKDQARWEGDHVHEILRVDAGVPVTHLAGDLLHYSYYDRSEHEARLEKYARLAAEKLRGRKGLAAKQYLSPAWRFVQSYFLKGGFLDGKAGYHLCRLTAKEVKRKYQLAQIGENQR